LSWLHDILDIPALCIISMVGLRSAANNWREQVEAGATAMSGLLPRVFLAVFALMSVPALWRSAKILLGGHRGAVREDAS
jgi:hypothetical protein